MTIIFLILLIVSDAFAAKKGRSKSSSDETGFTIRLVLGGGLNLAGEPNRTVDRTAFWFLCEGAKAGFGGQVLIDANYYFSPYVGANFGLGVGTFNSKWSGTDEYDVSREHSFSGIYIMPRVGGSLKYNAWVFNGGCQIAIKVSDKTTSSPSGTQWILKETVSVPVGWYVNLGYVIKTGSLEIPVGFEYVFMPYIHGTPNNTVIISYPTSAVQMNSYILFIGIVLD